MNLLRHNLALIVILTLAFGLRLGVGLWRLDSVHALPDSASYDRVAEGLLERGELVGRGYPVGPAERRADRMPGYPLVLAGLRWAFGEAAVSLVVLQALLGAATCWLAWRLGREVYGPLAGGLAAALMAVAPWQVFFATVALTEVWSTALVTAAALCAVCAIRRRRAAWAALAGALLGTAVYFQPGWAGLPLVVLPVALIAPQRPRHLGHWLLAVAVMAAMLSPWWVRNARVFGRFVPTTTRLGTTLYDAVRPEATGASDMAFERRLADRTAGLDELAYNRWYLDRAWAAVRDEPGRVAGLAGAKLARLWSPAPHAEAGQGGWLRVASGASFVAMVGPALLAVLVLVRRRAGALAVLLAPAVWVTMVHAVLVGSVRYRVPASGCLWVLSAVAVAWVFEGDVRDDD